MGKWLAIAGLVLVVLLFVMWRQLDDSAATPAPSATQSDVVEGTRPVAAKLPPVKKLAKPTGDDEPPTRADDVAGPEAKQPLNPASDLFYKHFIDIIPKRLWREAAVCYDGKVGSRKRDAKIKLAFNVVAKNGHVTVEDVRVANDEDTNQPVNTIGDPAIESCFIQKIARYSWDGNADMPDGYTLPDYTYPDELVIRPERSKKYYKDNLEYVGEEAPRR